MRFFTLTGAALTALILTAPARALAAENAVGQQEFESKCASCHGVDARGGGWMTKYISHRPPSLTQLTQKHGGVFPSDYVYQVIDGRKEVKLHGPRDMPIWGTAISAEIERKNLGLRAASKAVVRGRIDALVEYISQLQE